MNLDPELPTTARIPTFNPRLNGLWTEALNRPEAEMRLQVLLALPRAARLKMPEVEKFVPRILELLKDPAQDEAIHLAAADALAALDVKEAGEALLEQDRGGGLEMALVVDPALARWKARGASELWLGRVKNPATSDQLLRSALRCLGTLGGSSPAEATEAMRTVLMDNGRISGTRLAAAEALATLGPTNAAEIAALLVAGENLEDHLLAATMLPARGDFGIVELLVRLAQDHEPAVAAIAVEKLLAAAPDALAPLAKKLAESADAVIRRHSVVVLQRHADAPNISLLAALLGDAAPRVRGAAREALIALDGQASLRSLVRAAAKEKLASGGGGDWRAMEQAALIVGSLDEVSAKDRLVELLRDSHGQVRVGAVIGLRRLHLPETLPLELSRAQELAEQIVRRPASAKPAVPPAKPGASPAKTTAAQPRPVGALMRPDTSGEETKRLDEELAQLNQNLGLGKYGPADSYLARQIPKGSGWGEEARASAIWAAGYLHEGAPAAGPSRELKSRVSDTDPFHPEYLSVRVMSAISLGRMGDKSAMGTLKQVMAQSGDSKIAAACAWALAHLEGKPYVAPPPGVLKMNGWFLEPLE